MAHLSTKHRVLGLSPSTTKTAMALNKHLERQLGVAEHACEPNNLEGKGRRITGSSRPACTMV
ncbi:hypothetical protein I79_016435 [Cricetulus griseus]|uniref:Uncharacterized protein n=1 Tax=Cricetulus griseus TaxID=10029 RepID=G3HZD6_CRIGR|nr:hypothetical protein I79_016435 [Cricetulus griseus]